MKNTKNVRWCILALAICSAFLVTACTENQRARNFGGTATVDLAPGRKLVNATFKKDDLWLLTRAAKPDEKPEVFEFVEDSSFGVMNGKVIIRER
jgi:hypothetical protein